MTARRPAAVLALALAAAAVAGCGGGDDGSSDDGSSDDEAAATTTTSTTVPTTTTEARARPLAQILLQPRDLADARFEVVSVGERFEATEARRVLVCGEDLRTEAGTLVGRQSRFADEDGVEVSHTVTSGGDPAALVARFAELTESCPRSWTEPPLPTGGGPVVREVAGPYPVTDLGVEVDGAGAIIRSRNQRGNSDTIVVVLAAGEVLSSLSVSGPVGADFDVVEAAVAAAARRLGGLR